MDEPNTGTVQRNGIAIMQLWRGLTDMQKKADIFISALETEDSIDAAAARPAPIESFENPATVG